MPRSLSFNVRLPDALVGQEARSWRQLASGYRLTLIGGAVACLIALLLNVSVTIWAGTLPDLDGDGNGRRVLYQGSCRKSKSINTGLHILINLLSSVLLGASNYGIQCLSAPTREQVDKAHAVGTYLDIGIVSIRNLSRQTFLTGSLWLTLILSSVPLHLLYNSIVFSSLTVPSEYTVLQADERIEQSIDLFTSNIDNVQHAYEPSGSTAKIRALLEDSGKPGALERLTPSECIDQYAVSFLTSRNDVILVSQVTGDRNITLDWDYVTTTNVGERMESFSWICSGLEIHEPCRPKLDDIRKKADNWRPNGHRVKYCLSKPITKQLCRVNFNIPLAIGVILSNLVKMVVLVYIAIYLAPDRLLVLGDAIQSFVARPDTYSKQSCLASLRQIRHSPSRGSWIGMRVLTRVRKRWLSPVSAMRITVGAIQYAIAIGVSLFLLIWGISVIEMPRSFDNLWSLGFGQPSEETLILWGNSIGSGSVISTIAANVVVANSPHLIFSLIYFQWNAIFTSMLIGKEWNDFSLKSKPLRVSDRPQGKQRSRYFLQLPFKFSIPLIITSMLLHWIISQCIFVVSVEQIMRYVSPQQISWGILTCGYSPIAIMTVLLASLTIPVSVFVLGWRRLPGLMPVAGSCSLAIAAACHNRAAGTYPDVTQDVLKWGVMKDWKREQQSQEELTQEEDDGGDHGLSQTTSGCGHCGFSNAVVDDPQEGVAYE